MIAWNEAKTIDLAIKSTVGFADEVVIVDTGSFDGTEKIAQETIDDLDLEGYVKSVKITNLGQARLQAFMLCCKKWVLMQDSNLVLSEGLKRELKEFAESWERRKIPRAVGKMKSLNLIGDYEHYFGNQPFMYPHRVFTTRNHDRWSLGLDRPKFHGKKIEFKHWAVNLSRVRPAWRYWYRGEQFDRRFHIKGRGDDWINEANIQRQWQTRNRYNSIKEFLEREKGISIDDVKILAPQWFLQQLWLEAKPITEEMRKDMPNVIKEEWKNPRYKLIYENDRIVGRWPEL